MKNLKKKEVLDTTDLVYIFQKSKKTMARWRNAGILPKNKVSGGYYYRWEDIQILVRRLNDKSKNDG